jgi:hypothetical protein
MRETSVFWCSLKTMCSVNTLSLLSKQVGSEDENSVF